MYLSTQNGCPLATFLIETQSRNTQASFEPKKERNLLPIIFLSFRTLHLIAQPTSTGRGGAKYF